MSRLLIGSTLGEKSLLSLKVGVELAQKLGMKAHVIHADKLADYDTLDSVFSHLNLEVKEHYVDNILNANKEILKKELEGITEKSDDIVFEARAGIPSELLVTEARMSDVSLIVLGHEPHKSFVDMFLGRVTGAIVHRSEKSVLIVKNESARAPKKVLVAYDFTYHGNAALDWAKILGENFHSEIHLVNVIPCYYQGYRSGDAHLNKLNQALEEAIEESVREVELKLREIASSFAQEGLKIIPRYLIDKDASISNKLNQYIEENEIDLLVVGAHSRGKIAELFLGSVTSKMIKKSEVSVLIAK